METEAAILQQRQREPIAIVGMGCHFPGSESPAAYWQFLRNGDCAICHAAIIGCAFDNTTPAGHPSRTAAYVVAADSNATCQGS